MELSFYPLQGEPKKNKSVAITVNSISNFSFYLKGLYDSFYLREKHCHEIYSYVTVNIHLEKTLFNK